MEVAQVMAPSEKQQDIFDLWHNDECNIVINAVAGSGKTTTLMQLLSQIEERTLFLAFNKSIQVEIQEKMDNKGYGQGKALTMHALGLMAIRHAYSLKINNGKNFDLIKKVQNVLPQYFGSRKMTWEDKLRASFTLMDFNDISRMYVTDDLEQVKFHMTMVDKLYFEFPGLEESWEKMKEFRYASYEQPKIEVDFQDMIFLPVYKSLYIPLEPRYLFIDECQDLNLAQHKLIDMFIEQGSITKWVAVGDRNQAIYGFSGATANSFEMFVSKGNVRQMPLDVCYRCSRSIVAAANEVFNVMRPFKGEDGLVRTIDNLELVRNDSMIICRNTNPLFQTYFQLLGLGKSCYIKGEEVFTNLKRFMKPYNRDVIGTAKEKMRFKIQELSLKNTEQSRIAMYRFKDNYKNFQLLTAHLCGDRDTVAFLEQKLAKIFVNMDNAIMLCTIHKSKGMEADIVYILNESLIPSKYAKSQQQILQETNLKYVARTRAKKELYYLNLDL